VLPGAAFLTAGSPLIAEAYKAKYGLRPIPVNNTFPLPAAAPSLEGGAGREFRLFWFSQTIGPDRGLEDAVRAAGQLGRSVRLGMLGRTTDFVEKLTQMANKIANLQLEIQNPCLPDEIVARCRGWDVGLAMENRTPLNRDLCLTNKIFTYPLAGLAIAATDTTAQRQAIPEFGEGAFLFPPGDSAALAVGLKRWADDPAMLVRAKKASWEAAQRRWHWEHPLERGALLDAVERAIGKP
jgi:glycosyltransferase involved in cell wall biosynthesis